MLLTMWLTFDCLTLFANAERCAKQMMLLFNRFGAIAKAVIFEVELDTGD